LCNARPVQRSGPASRATLLFVLSISDRSIADEAHVQRQRLCGERID
jgi:hypothetical protein